MCTPAADVYHESCIRLEIRTETVSRTLVYRPEKLALLQLDIPSASVQEFMQTICARDMGAGGFLIRLLRSLPTDAPPCILTTSPILTTQPLLSSEDRITVDTCFTPEETSAQTALRPVDEDGSVADFRDQHGLPSTVGIYVICIVQPVSQLVFSLQCRYLSRLSRAQTRLHTRLPHS